MSLSGAWPLRRSDPETNTGRQRIRAEKSLLSRAITLLARRDHSRAELSQKLARYVREDGEPGEVNQVLAELDRNGLISDERFAGALARSRSQRFGDARIRYDLRRFGIADDLSAAALAKLSGTEVSRADLVRSNRFAELPSSAAERAKQARFLRSRGFSIEVICRVLRGRIDMQ